MPSSNEPNPTETTGSPILPEPVLAANLHADAETVRSVASSPSTLIEEVAA